MSELYTIRTVDDNSLQHYGVLGMKWGRRKASYSKQKNKSYRDFEKLKKLSSRAMNTGVKAYNFQRDHTYMVGA